MNISTVIQKANICVPWTTLIQFRSVDFSTRIHHLGKRMAMKSIDIVKQRENEKENVQINKER